MSDRFQLIWLSTHLAIGERSKILLSSYLYNTLNPELWRYFKSPNNKKAPTTELDRLTIYFRDRSCWQEGRVVSFVPKSFCPQVPKSPYPSRSIDRVQLLTNQSITIYVAGSFDFAFNADRRYKCVKVCSFI